MNLGDSAEANANKMLDEDSNNLDGRPLKRARIELFPKPTINSSQGKLFKHLEHNLLCLW
jgi:hypothetical protein